MKLAEEAMLAEPKEAIEAAYRTANPFAAISIYPVKLLLLAACILVEKRHGSPLATEKTVFIPEQMALGVLEGMESALASYQQGNIPDPAQNN